MFRNSLALFSALLVSFASTQANSQTTSTSTLTTASPIPTSSMPNSICGSGSLGNGKCGWVSGSSTRSTYSILWSCFAVILLCTYKVIHLNICSEAEHAASWKQWYFYRKKLRKFGVMLVAVLAPELIPCYTYKDWRGARRVRLAMNKEGFSCSMALAFYICMGGLAIRTPSGTTLIGEQEYMELMNIDERDDIVAQLPHYQDIVDRSKTDSLTTILACLQSIWLVVQCIGRTVEGAAISELELITCGFVLCSVVTYAFWWNKPYDVEHRTIINLPEAAELQIAEIVKENDAHKTDYEFDRVHLDDFTTHNGVNSMYLVLLLGTLFSAVHLAAWNWAFPTKAELWLWRASSLTLLGVCFTILLRLVAWDITIAAKVTATLSIIYSIARVIILVQIFLCFRAMPEIVYKEVAWAQFIPHLS
ncbi:hypothetical protein BDZ45DRAFT_634377 [Acephala macrosclerotiorum]|nr:hypothetical protein BDZ45DRAFT_634377 [Acephala macrosclerotiorum]